MEGGFFAARESHGHSVGDDDDANDITNVQSVSGGCWLKLGWSSVFTGTKVVDDSSPPTFFRENCMRARRRDYGLEAVGGIC